jgi:Uma2 family endonuclease
MAQALKKETPWTPEEYLAFDRAAPEGEKYEFLDGKVVPWNGDWKSMAGASRSHNRIMLRLGSMLDTRLRGKPCEPFGSEQRVQLPGGGYVYPDVFVACDTEFADEKFDTVTNPVVIFEVISPSTAKKDRTTKFRRYQRITSLRDYVLIEQEFRAIYHHSRAEDGQHWWLRVLSQPDEELILDSIECRLPLSEIYERVEFPEDEQEAETSNEEPLST